MQATTAPAVSVVDLVVDHGGLRAVDGLSLELHAGSVLALLGPNGAGKTSTVEVVEGYRRPTSGVVRVLGLDPVADAARVRPRLGLVLQSGGVQPGLRTREVLDLHASFAAHPLDVDELVERLGLGRVAATPWRRLSGGQQRRVALALALLPRPEVVVLDEPTAGLDPQARREVWGVVSALRQDGVAVLLTTHDMEEAERLADDVVVVDLGRAVARGTPSELTRAGAEGQLRFTSRPGLALEELLLALPEATTAKEDPPGHYLVQGVVDPQLLATLTAWCAGHGVRADDLQVERRTLEDVVLELTGRTLRP